MAGSLVVAFLNYLYYPALGRILPVAEFGELQAILAIYLQFSVLVYIFSLAITHIASNEKFPGANLSEINSVANLANWAALIAGLLFFLCSPLVKDYLKLSLFAPLLTLAPIFWLTARIGIYNAYRQGRQELHKLNIANFISSGGRLFFALALIALGASVFGALAALFLAQALSLLYLGNGLLSKPAGKFVKIKFGPELTNNLKHSVLALFAVSSITFFYSADVIFARHYFSAEEAGVYGGISAIARMLYFFSGPIAGALLPAVKIKASEKDNQRILIKSILLTLAVNFILFLTFCVFYHKVIGFLLGEKYQSLANLLPGLSFLMFLVSIVNLLFYYYLALRRYALIPISMIGVSISLIAIIFNHDSLSALIADFSFGAGAMLFILLFDYAKNYFHYHSGFQRGA